jgi:hypothetical protein
MTDLSARRGWGVCFEAKPRLLPRAAGAAPLARRYTGGWTLAPPSWTQLARPVAQVRDAATTPRRTDAPAVRRRQPLAQHIPTSYAHAALSHPLAAVGVLRPGRWPMGEDLAGEL